MSEVYVPPCIPRLKRDHGIEHGIEVLLSTERPRCELVTSAEMAAGNPLDYQVRSAVTVKYSSILGLTW